MHVYVEEGNNGWGKPGTWIWEPATYRQYVIELLIASPLLYWGWYPPSAPFLHANAVASAHSITCGLLLPESCYWRRDESSACCWDGSLNPCPCIAKMQYSFQMHFLICHFAQTSCLTRTRVWSAPQFPSAPLLKHQNAGNIPQSAVYECIVTSELKAKQWIT